jgi:hypothetical protein
MTTWQREFDLHDSRRGVAGTLVVEKDVGTAAETTPTGAEDPRSPVQA